jgi:DNA polymerase-4
MHADVDAFYASVEQRDNPALRGIPVAVGGDPNRRGVIMTASYEARQFGVHSAMPSMTAVRLCPQLILVPPRFDAYTQASRTIMEILRVHATTVEPMSLDEAFMDVTGVVADFDVARTHATRIKELVREHTKLSISLGVAGSKLVAKIASDYEKPDGLTVVPTPEARAFLAPLTVRKLWGIGPKTEQVLRGVGIETAGQLAEADEDWLLGRLGAWALRWRLLAQGVDVRLISTGREYKQSSREITFDRDTRDRDVICRTINNMAGNLASSLASTGAAGCVHIKIRYSDFRTITRQRRTKSLLEAEQVAHQAIELFDQWWDGRPVRLVGIGLSRFVHHPKDQLSLFPPSEE